MMGYANRGHKDDAVAAVCCCPCPAGGVKHQVKPCQRSAGVGQPPDDWQRFREVTEYGVIPLPSGAGAVVIHVEEGRDCLLFSAFSGWLTRCTRSRSTCALDRCAAASPAWAVHTIRKPITPEEPWRSTWEDESHDR
jgi:hypothetical protein